MSVNLKEVKEFIIGWNEDNTEEFYKVADCLLYTSYGRIRCYCQRRSGLLREINKNGKNQGFLQ